MDAKDILLKIKVMLGMAEAPAEPVAPEAPAETPVEQTELAAEKPAEAPAESETTETALEAEQPAEAPAEAPTELAEQPAEPAPAEPEVSPLEKRVNDLESKIDELYGVIQALVEKQAVEAKQEVPPTTTATPAQFAAQEEVKPLTRADKILALKNN